MALNGGVGSLVLDTIGHIFSKKYHNRVIQVNISLFLLLHIMMSSLFEDNMI